MDLGEIYQENLYIANKHQRGDSLTPDQYNIMLKSENINLFNIEMDKLKQLALEKKLPIYDVYDMYYDSSPLRIFEENTGLEFDPGELKKSALNDYAYMLTGIVLYNGGWRKIDFVSDKEAHRRRTSISNKPLYYHPIGIERSSKFNFIPGDIKEGSFVYFKEPKEPNFDYCIRNDTNESVYMTVDSYIDNDNKLYDKDGNVMIGGQEVTHLDSPSLPYTSKSIELEWEKHVHHKIAGLILTKMGVNIRDAELLQYSLREEQKQKT